MSERKTTNKYLILFAIILASIITFKVTDYFADKRLEKERIETRKLKIANSKLEKISEGHYQKLVADTLTKKQLRERIDELEIKVKDGVLVAESNIKPKDVEKQIDSVLITPDSISIIDYYPKKENFFIKYSALLNLKDSTQIGKFSFSPLSISMVVSEQEDGTFLTDLKAPDFITLESLDVQSLPLTPPKIDNFGFLAGGGVNRGFQDGSLGYEIMAGLRIKKFNLITSVNTQQQFGLAALIEF